MGNKTSCIKELLSDDELLKRIEEYIDREYEKIQHGNKNQKIYLSNYENKYFREYIMRSKDYGDFSYRLVLIEKIVEKFKKRFVVHIDYSKDERFRYTRGVCFEFTQPSRTTEEVIEFVKEHLEGLNRSMKYLKEYNFLYHEKEERMKEVEQLLEKIIEQHKIISAPGVPE